jgi:small-conductance mechanosensitive channel
MLINTWGEVFTSSLQSLWWGFANFAPKFIFAIIVFIIGWVLGGLVEKAIESVVGALKIDKLFRSAGAEEVLSRAGMKLNVGGFLGGLVKWFIIVVFLMTSLEIVQLTNVTDFLRTVVVGYLPNVIVAALVLIIATIVADVVKKLIVASARAAQVSSAGLFGSIAKYAIWVFALIIALSQLGIAPQLMQILFTGIVAMLAIAGGLAFGLGGRDAAMRTIETLHGEVK